MSPTPSRSIAPDFIQGLDCPICGQDALQLQVMDRFPDYVTCTNCESQFVLEEGGERVMYGKIPAAYPRTRRFALQQWAWPEAVARRAIEERPQQPDLPSPPPAMPAPTPESEPTPSEPEGIPPELTGVPEGEPTSPEATARSPLDRLKELEPEPPASLDELEVGEPPTPESEDVLEPTWMPDAEPEDQQPMEAAPPFGEGPAEPTLEEEFPSELEPAPEMPEWLQTKTPEPEPTGAGAEPPEVPAATPSYDDEPEAEEDLTATLWEDESPSEEPADRPLPEPEWMAGAGEAPAQEAGLDQGEDDFAALFEGEPELAPEDEFPGDDEMAPDEPLAGIDEHKLSESEVAEMMWTGRVAAVDQPGPPDEAGPETPELEMAGESEPIEREPQEPEPGTRYRVVLQGTEPRFPGDLCAHCSRTPTSASLQVAAAVYQGSGLGERRLRSYRIPLCADCHARVTARSEEQQTARIQAHLVSVLVGLVMVVGGLAFGLADFQGAVLLDLVILLLLGGMGYLIPAIFLLLRASRFPKPADAEFVETTLRVPSDTEGMETAFEWRNAIYAGQFLDTNQEIAATQVNKIRERSYEG